MNYKANYRIVIIIHLVGVIILGCVMFFAGAAVAAQLKLVVGVLLISMGIQVIMFRFRPKWFTVKMKKGS